jgi:hypothetical protein
MLSALLVLITVWGSTGCSPRLQRSLERPDVFGRYVANHGKGLDVIELSPDGTYLYAYRSSDGKEFRNKGRWTFYRQDGAPSITFDDFEFGLNGYGSGKPAYWDVEVEASWLRELRLSLDPDLNYYYLKQRR